MVNSRLVKWAAASLEEKKPASDDSLEQLSRLTIIIPSYCRQDCLLRQAVYWGQSRARVVIVDGSPESLSAQVRDLISHLPNLTYLHTVDTYVNRLKEACRYIKTPYAMALADDDFFLMTGLCRAIESLDRNSDLVACMGQAMAVDYKRDNGGGYFYPYGGSLWRYQVTHANAIERLHFGIDNYRSVTSYAMFRGPIFTEIWHTIGPWSCPEATEYAHAIITYILGGISTIDDLYWLRSSEYEWVSNAKDWNRTLDFRTWWSSQDFKHERADFVARLVSKLADHSSLNTQEATNIIMEVINYILLGRHEGLTNHNAFEMLISHVLKFVSTFRLLDEMRKKIWNTKFSIWTRNRIRAVALRATVNPKEAAAFVVGDRIAREAEDVLRLMSRFYAAQGSVT